MSDDEAMSHGICEAIRASSATAQRLRAAGVAPEELAVFVPARTRLLVLQRRATMRPIGQVWRLGALLLGTSPDGLDAGGGGAQVRSPGSGAHPLYALGRATRAAARGRAGYQSLSREERKDIAAAALHGGYPEGTAVNFDASPLTLSVQALRHQGPESVLGWHAGAVRVRWQRGASLEGAPSLADYLSERTELLISSEP